MTTWWDLALLTVGLILGFVIGWTARPARRRLEPWEIDAARREILRQIAATEYQHRKQGTWR